MLELIHFYVDLLHVGGLTSTGQILAPAGSNAAPGYAFSTDNSTGMYWYGPPTYAYDYLGFTVGGSQVGNWTGLGTSGALTIINNLQVGQTIYADNQIKFVTDGSASTPLLTFYNDSTTGLFRDTVSTTGIGVTVG